MFIKNSENKLAKQQAEAAQPKDLDINSENMYKVNVQFAQRDPLGFIDSVLRHHGQIE